MKADDTLLHAYLDGELDAAAGAEVERELSQNPALRASFERMRELSLAVRDKADYHRAPSKPRRADRPRRAWILVPSFAAVLALGVGIGLYLAQPRETGLGDEAVAGHVRATLVGQVIQIASTDQHMVKPWLSARLAFSPPVVDFSQDGFQLEGGRVDVIGGKPAAVLVYKRRQHLIDVYLQPGGSDSIQWHSAHDGFNVERFAAGGMHYWVVSDLNRNELGDFARMLASRR